MRYEMRMPDLATTESEIRIVRWLIEPGERIERGQPLVEVETDKATMEVESVASGMLAEVRAEVGAEVAVGDVIALVEVENVSAAVASAGVAQAAEAMPSASPPSVAIGASRKPPGRPAGMFARNRAAATSSAPAAPSGGVPLSIAQRTAARRLQESKQTVPHFYLQTSVNASAIIARRKAAEPARLAWDAFFVRAVARAIARFDRFRCRLDGERLTPAGTDAIGVAIDHEGELYVIPIASPADKSVEQISDEIRRNVERLRSGDPDARRIRPALMTVTNLGVANVETFIPIINPPEAAVLGVGKAMPTPVVMGDGSIGVEPRCTITLSADHRVTSGKYAADFLGAIVEELESL